MPRKEIETILDIAKQYLNGSYNIHGAGGLPAQKEQEEKVFEQVVAVVAKKDQNVLKIWNIVKKVKGK